MRKLSKRKVIKYLIEHLIYLLSEYQGLKDLSEFSEGALLAYVECLEILSQWKGFKKYGITDIEKYFGIE